MTGPVSRPDPEQPERDPLSGLPPDLARVLRDQSVVVSQDGAVFDLIGKWLNAKSDTASAPLPPVPSPDPEQPENAALSERERAWLASMPSWGDVDGVRLIEKYDGLLAERDQRITRESAKALIEEAQRWQRAYDRARNETIAAEAALVQAKRELEISQEDHDITEAHNLARAEAAEGRVRALTDALKVADGLLDRLSRWDMLFVGPEGQARTGDAPFWQGEIARARAALVVATEPTLTEPGQWESGDTGQGGAQSPDGSDTPEHASQMPGSVSVAEETP